MKMMILASSGSFLTNSGILSYLPKPINQFKIAWVTTASKGVSDLSYLARHKQNMVRLGCDFEEIDIEGKSESELRKILAGKDLVHVEGGNSFYLLKAVRKSGFDKVINDLIEKGVIYIGTSAGSYIMCPTIEVSTWKGNHDHCGVTDLTALKYVPFLLFAHYKPDYDDLLKEKIKTASCPVKILTDEQALLAKDGKVALIGDGAEIKV